jgi:Asp-tRNA(Asn)/Glu-tRNA(Gln) amidotransferase A subunit family amidase
MLQQDNKALQGLRIAIVREHMVKSTANHVAISDQVDRELKTVLRDRLGAELVETSASGYPDDADVSNLAFTFNDALSELLPRLMPEIFKRRDRKGQLVFDVPGYDVTSYDYLVKLSRREAPLTDKVNITNFATFGAAECQPSLCPDELLDFDRYLKQRGDSRITDWGAWVSNAKFRDDAGRAGAENWRDFKDHWRDGKGDTLARSLIARMALQRVMAENHIDAFVHPENTVPTPKIQGPNVGSISLDGITPFFQIPKIAVPAGFTDVIVEPSYALNADQTDYVPVIAPGTTQTRLKHPLPISITFFAGQGEEGKLIRIGTAYEAATHHRTAPPDFGPVAARKGK